MDGPIDGLAPADTRPTPLETLKPGPGGLDDIRIGEPRALAALLRDLQYGSVRLNLNGSDGVAIPTTLWSVDTEQRTISFSVDAQDTRLLDLLECEEAVAVGYMENIKLQFDVRELVLVRGARASVLRAALPHEVFRFQRRGGYRVRPVARSAPVARLRHPDLAEMQLALRVLDLSIGGCALFLPDDVPPIQPGFVSNRVQIEMDDETRFVVDLRLQHVTSLGADSRGVRLGCEFVDAAATTLRDLQRFIDRTQQRSRVPTNA
jgi:flagellar brake protein